MKSGLTNLVFMTRYLKKIGFLKQLHLHLKKIGLSGLDFMTRDFFRNVYARNF